MMFALYVAFWLQLKSAASAAVTVGILALPTRGQACQKEIYRLLMGVVGVIASIIILLALPTERSLTEISARPPGARRLGFQISLCAPT
jgi:uncharacterized membrane protein YccC